MSERLEITIRRTVEGDYGFLQKWFEDPENNTLFTSEFRNIGQYKKIFLLMALGKKENAYYTVLGDDGRPVGFVSLIHIDPIDRCGQFWYVTGDKDVRNMGIMTRAVGTLCEIARDELSLHSVYTWVVEDNIASIRVLERNGFRMAGLQKEAFFDGKTFKDKIWFDKVLREGEWNHPR